MLRRLVPIAVVTLALAGCGDDKKDSSAEASSSSTTQTTVSTTTTTAASTTTTASAGLSESSPLRFDGIGPIKVGMTLAEATKAVGKPVTAGSNDPADGCSKAEVQGGPAGLKFLVERAKATDPWRIARVEVTDPSRIASFTGVRIGATESEVETSWSVPKGGKVEKTAHKYVEGGHYITFDQDGPAGNLMLFETDGKKVTEFRSGQQTQVEYVEGCA